MGYPAEIPVRSVTVAGAGVQAVYFIASPSRGLVWAASGYRLETVPVQVEATGAVTVALPVTDSAGWRDLSGNLIDVSASGSFTHTYTARVIYRSADGRVEQQRNIGPFVIPTGTGAVNLDSLIPTGTSVGAAVSIPDSWAGYGATAQAAAVAAQAAAATAQGAALVQALIFGGN